MQLLRLFAAITVSIAVANAKTDVEYEEIDYADYSPNDDMDAPRNVIFMIPDGTAPDVFTLARNVHDPTLKQRLHIDSLQMGTVETHSSTSRITDSAAAATAYATGFKTFDAGIGVDDEKKPLGTILEAAKARGMVTGMIVTVRVTHATPAGFASHVKHRDEEAEIARQYVNDEHLDFILGGGAKFFNESLQQEIRAKQYTIVNDYDSLMAYKKANEASGNLRLFGLFAHDHMSFEIDRLRDLNEYSGGQRQPSLQEMVDAVLSILKNNPVAKKNGFFLMIEGSKIDFGNHANDAGTVAKEAIAFDQAVGVVKQFVHKVKNTALISCADHGTGGMTLGRDGVYAWYPQILQLQTMSSDLMKEILTTELKNCGTNDNQTCKDSLGAKAKELIFANSNLTEIPTEWQAQFNTDLDKTVDKTRNLNEFTITIGRILSSPARIKYTSTGHVGTDVNLYCMGPSEFTHHCPGVHENIMIPRMIASYLNLNLQKETLKLRGFQVHPVNELYRE